ncbi:hypothetical protein ACFFRR_006074 [Megaselia abdita]
MGTTIKMEEGAKMSEFLNTFFDLFGRIKTFEEHLSERLVASILLNAMSKSYENSKLQLSRRRKFNHWIQLRTSLLKSLLEGVRRLRRKKGFSIRNRKVLRKRR